MAEPSTPKRDAILSTGKDLFWKFGYSRVTVEEICSKAGISKMTFYKYFSNKKELVKTIMDNLMENSLARYQQIAESNLSYPEKVKKYLMLKKEVVHHMSNEFYREYLKSADPELTGHLAGYSQKSFAIFTQDFSRAQKNGDIRKDIKIGFILYMMNHMVDFTDDDALLDMYDEPEDLVMEIINFLFYGILNRETHQ